MTSARLSMLAVLLTALAVAGGVSGEGSPDMGEPRGHEVLAAVGAGPGPRLPETRALEVLHHWDVRRARAWARADPAGLARLYVPGSLSGRRDVAMLQRWRSRGLRVRHLRMQVLDVRVRLQSRRRLVLEVTDRVVGATAVGRGDPGVLPRDRASSHVITLRRGLGEWRVSEVRVQRPARRMARTPASRNS